MATLKPFLNLFLQMPSGSAVQAMAHYGSARKISFAAPLFTAICRKLTLAQRNGELGLSLNPLRTCQLHKRQKQESHFNTLTFVCRTVIKRDIH